MGYVMFGARHRKVRSAHSSFRGQHAPFAHRQRPGGIEAEAGHVADGADRAPRTVGFGLRGSIPHSALSLMLPSALCPLPSAFCFLLSDFCLLPSAY